MLPVSLSTPVAGIDCQLVKTVGVGVGAGVGFGVGVEVTLLPVLPPPQAEIANITGAIITVRQALKLTPNLFAIIRSMPLPDWCRVVEHMRARRSMPPVFPTRGIVFREPPDIGGSVLRTHVHCQGCSDPGHAACMSHLVELCEYPIARRYQRGLLRLECP